jgi:hypothetical protein
MVSLPFPNGSVNSDGRNGQLPQLLAPAPAPAHEPTTCGIDGPESCPGCAWEKQHTLSDDDRLELLVLELGLPRRPKPLDHRGQTDLLLSLLDLRESCRRDADFGRHVRTLLAALLKERQ